MLQRATHYLAMLATLYYLALAPAQAQVLKGTFAAGTNHSLSIHADGTLWATGGNGNGQLGDGTTTLRTSWVQVGTATNWVQVVAGNFFSLGLRTDGTLWAWGINIYGQLGSPANNGQNAANPTPTQIAGTYTQVAASWEHSLALKADGSLWSWGGNYHGELGRSTNVNTTAANPVPTPVPGTYTQLSAGSDYSLALRADGTLWSWGNNYFGQLGTANNPGLNTANPVPAQVAGVYTSIGAGAYHALALRADGSLWAWGNNNYGGLGTLTNNGTNAANAVPTQVAGTYTSAAAGFYHSLALRADGTLWAWGLNDYGQLGNGTSAAPPVANPVPTQVPGTYVQAELGFHYTLALRADGSLLAWGDNGQGQFGTPTGLGTSNPNPTPAIVGTALPTRSTAANFQTSLAIRGDGTLWAWGSNLYGQLGNGTAAASRARPGQVGTDHDWVQVVAGSAHVLALKANGTAWAWGNNTYTQASPALVPVIGSPSQVSGYTFASIAAGANHNLGLTATGQLYAWGNNNYRQLGVGDLRPFVSTPTPVSGGLAWVGMAAGGEFSLGRTATGQVYGWGNNYFGQVGAATGVGTATPVAAPTLVASVPALRQVSAGYVFSLGLAATGVAYGWGINEVGQLGTATNSGTSAANATPLVIAGLAPLRQLEAYSAHSLGLTAAGTIYSWGSNVNGTLGQGTFNPAANPVPAQEITLSTAWAQLGSGSSAAASLVRTASGQSFASAGSNADGQLGDGTTTDWPRFDRMSPLTPLQSLPVLAATAGLAFGLAPNPARTQATAVGLPTGTTLAVYDALGRLVLAPAGLTFGVAGLPAGLYVVRATAPGQPARTTRLVVE